MVQPDQCIVTPGSKNVSKVAQICCIDTYGPVGIYLFTRCCVAGAAMEPAAEGERKWEGRGGSGLEDLRKEDREETEGLHIRDPRRYFQRAPQVPPPPIRLCIQTCRPSSLGQAQPGQTTCEEGEG